jgi:hypothetical protein
VPMAGRPEHRAGLLERVRDGEIVGFYHSRSRLPQRHHKVRSRPARPTTSLSQRRAPDAAHQTTWLPQRLVVEAPPARTWPPSCWT